MTLIDTLKLSSYTSIPNYLKLFVGIFSIILFFLAKSIIYPYHLSPYRNLPRHRFSLYHYFEVYYNLWIGNYAYFINLHNRYGSVVHLFDRWVVINNPSIKKHWLTYKYAKMTDYSSFDINGPNIFSTYNKEFHISRKKIISPAFNNKTLSAMEGTIYKVGSQSLVDYIDSFLERGSSHTFDLAHLFHFSTLDVISELVFGENLNCINDQKKAAYYLKELKKSQLMLFLRTLVPPLKYIHLPLENLFKPIILNNIQIRKNSDKIYQDILQSMIDSEDPDTGAKLSPIEIVDECLVLLFAGMDTTANTLIWTLYELLKNPETYELIENEILQCFSDLEKPISLEKCKHELKYLEAAILESMRLHPVAAGGLPREVPEGGLIVDGHYLPKNTVVTIQVYTEQNDPKYWDHPTKFDIHRWLGSDRDQNKAKLCNFGLGTRGCIGRDLAWDEIYLVLANLIRHFNMNLIDTELTPQLTFLYTPKEGRMRVQIQRRD